MTDMTMTPADVDRLNEATVTTVESVITFAARHDITLTRADFTADADEFVSLDGMAPGDWLDAMLMD